MRWMSLMLLLAGCGAGQLSLTAWGEEFIEQEIPATVFEDGHSVRYSKFLVVVRDFTLAKRTGEVAATQPHPVVMDLTKPGPVKLFEFQLPAFKYDEVSYRIGPADDAVAVGEVSEADVGSMRAGASLRVEGTVSNGAQSKRFAWAFSVSTHYSRCENLDFGEGVTVPNGSEETVQLTLHGDHLWYDGLQADDAKVRGAAILAADANDDGEVTMAELAAVQLTSLPLSQYDTTGAGGVKTLADFVTALSRTVGHFRGEGDCSATTQ